MPLAVPGLLLLQSLSCREARTPLGADCSLAVIHRRAVTRRRGLVTDRFTDARSRSCLDPPDGYGLPFRAPRAASASRGSLPPSWTRFLVPLGLEQRNRRVPPASPASELPSSLQVQASPPGLPLPATPAPLLEFLPSRAFSPHASDSLTHPGPGPGLAPRPPVPSRILPVVRRRQLGCDRDHRVRTRDPEDLSTPGAR